MTTTSNDVEIYFESGRWAITVSFTHKWQARLFHILLNNSKTHNGRRGY